MPCSPEVPNPYRWPALHLPGELGVGQWSPIAGRPGCHPGLSAGLLPAAIRPRSCGAAPSSVARPGLSERVS